MMTIPNNQKPVSHIYGSMRGVDLTSDYTKVEDYRSPCMVNFYRDYDDEAGSLRTRPRMKYEGPLLPESVTGAKFDIRETEDNYGYWEYDLSGKSKLIKIGSCLFFVADKDRDLEALSGFDIDNYIKKEIGLNPVLIKSSTDETVSVVLLSYDIGYAGKPPIFVDYSGKVYVYTRTYIGHDANGKPDINETGRQHIELYILYFEKNISYLTGQQFLDDYKKQKMIFAGYGMSWNSGKFEMVDASFGDDEYSETLAPLILTECNMEGGGTPNLPSNIFSNFVRIGYSFYASSDFETAGLVIPVDAYSAKIRVLFPDKIKTGEYEEFELTKTGGRWNSDELKTRVEANIASATDKRFIFDAVVLAATSSFLDERDEFVSVKKTFLFDERMFFAGLTMASDKIRYCQASNPMYLPDTAWQVDGQGTGVIKDVLVFANYFAVLQDDKYEEKAIYLHSIQAVESETLTRVYPSTYTLGAVGVVNENCSINVNDCALFLSYDGLKQIVSTDIKSAASIQHKSSMIDGELIPAIKANPERVRLFKYKNYVGILTGSDIYLGDTNALYSNSTTKDAEFEWFKWSCFSFYHLVANTMVYPYDIREKNGLEIYYNYIRDTRGGTVMLLPLKYTLTHDAEILESGDVVYQDEITYREKSCYSPVECFIATKYDNFGAYQYWKDCNRMWQTAAISFQLEGKPETNTSQIDIYEFTNTQNKFVKYEIDISQNGVTSNPQITINEGKSVKTLSDIYKRVSDSHIRYSLRSKRFEDLSIMFRFRSPVRFYYATAQAFIRGPVKR